MSQAAEERGLLIENSVVLDRLEEIFGPRLVPSVLLLCFLLFYSFSLHLSDLSVFSALRLPLLSFMFPYLVVVRGTHNFKSSLEYTET